MTSSYRYGQPGVFTTKVRIGKSGLALAHLSVAAPNLARLPVVLPEDTFSGYYLVGGAGVDNQDNPSGNTSAHIHPSNHWGTQDLIAAIDEVSTEYMHSRIAEFRKINPTFNAIGSNVKVLVNDMSLQRGGLFDVNGTWAPSHFEHRKGTEVDMITERDPNDDELVRLWARVTGNPPLVHDGSDGLPLHIHGRI